MAEIGLFYGSDEGNTERVAGQIQARLGLQVEDVHDIADVTQMEFVAYEKIILGIPTWDFGQIQSDWEEFWEDVSQVDFRGKSVALFGLGDQFGYGDFFLDAMGMLHDVVKARGGILVGYWSAEGYEFDASRAWLKEDNLFVGLGIDEDQQPELSCARLNIWCAQIHREFALQTPVLKLED